MSMIGMSRRSERSLMMPSSPFSHRSELKINQYHLYFGVAVRKWITIARNKLIQRIEYILDKDNLDQPFPSPTNQKFTPSAFDISQCFTQIAQFWRRLGLISFLLRFEVVHFFIEF